ncbi:Chromatin assembly factor 1 subunit rlf2 [Escovopsis weberi]|uniref:Chromatin assembly factor 1 subunit rlf2 n=1 Tax=Escovopsis weberi TaxID=150374 RepID=A0A0M8N2W6_ESCWE|nr:Chromatin assembly factor 1 subunit rlf2 [Escovopsis weberi]
MPLLEVSPNIKDLEPASRKRSHDEFSDGLRGEEAAQGDRHQDTMPKASAKDISATMNTMTLSVKRKRLTGAEKEARDRELAEQKKIRDQQLAEKAALKAAEKAKLEEAKAARARERDEKRKKKEEEQQRLQEEKDRKARSQKTLGSFFKIPSTSKKTNGEVAPKASSPAKSDAAAAASIERAPSAYSTMFKPFFVKENTRLAPILHQMGRATQDAKSRDLDGFILRAQRGGGPLEFRPRELLGLAGVSACRGRHHRPVKHIMDWAYRESQHPGATGAAEAKRISDQVREQLRRIPVKVISFSQDVRPPYYGTQTLKTFSLGKTNMERLARRSTSRRLPLDYDYDSEAEWQEEEGEDVDVDDDEEELDDEDDMDGFLDDSEDTGLTRRVFGNTMEPECTGICFEDENQIGPNASIYDNKMEFMLDNLKEQCIDPFSTQYWEAEPVPVRTKQSRAVRAEAETKAAGGAGASAPQAPANAFAALQGAGHAPAPTTKLVKAELLNDFKQAILDNKALSKVGIIDIIFHQFRDSVSRAEVKNTLEVVAEKKGVGRLKEWELRPGHEIVM